MISVHLQGIPFSITVIQVYAPTSNAEEAEVERFYEEYTEELYKKELHDLDNHYGVTTHLEPDILKCEVKWALESITMNKASGGDGQWSYFKS